MKIVFTTSAHHSGAEGRAAAFAARYISFGIEAKASRVGDNWIVSVPTNTPLLSELEKTV